MTDQTPNQPSWEDIRFFIALARHGSLAAAARALNVNHTTVARRIASLEQALGAKLVERRPDGFVLTAEGAHAVASAHQMEAAAATLARPGTNDSPKGLVRISATPGLALEFLSTRLPRLTAQHEGLDIELSASVRAVSLDLREADVALRFGRPLDGDVIARPLVTLAYGFYATPQWQQRAATGATPVFVAFDEANSSIADAAWLMRCYPRARLAFRADNQLAQAAAARAGAGIAMLPHFIGRSIDGLVPCALEPLPPSRELWMITRPGDNKNLAVRAVTDFLTEAFAEERALFDAQQTSSMA
ncbi:MAG TPA: LysR family transcriptional regulator [Paraburkholderia sp.]|jgi:DNA-binding transcriptional LysR family regulator|nr:LysR family transcriptional regulator [Paraburkholderia sp.]